MKEVFQNQPSQQEITGLNPDSSDTQNIDVPTLSYDKRGRIIWRAKRGTPEDNLKLGINNIRALVLAEAPEVANLPLDENGRIREKDRKWAESYILEKVRSDKKSNNTIVPCSRPTNYPTEYRSFGRSIPYTLSVAFNEYGLFENEGQQFLVRKRRSEQPPPSEITLIDSKTNTQSTIKPIDNKTGREKLTKLIKGELTIDEIEPIYITAFTGHKKCGSFRTFYKGKKVAEIIVNPTAYKAYEEKGGLLAIPKKDGKFGYQWFDFYSVDQDNTVNLSNKLESVRFNNHDGTFDRQGWNGLEHQAFIDYLSGSLRLDNPNELPPFSAKVTSGREKMYQVNISKEERIIFRKSTPLSSEEVFIQPKYDEKRKYEWIEGYDMADTEHIRLLFTRRIIDSPIQEDEDKEKQVKKHIVSWKGPKIQSIIDWAHGNLPIEDVEEGETLMGEDKKNITRSFGDPDLTINLRAKYNSLDKTKPIHFVAKEEKPYRWIEAQQEDNLDGNNRRRLLSMFQLEIFEGKLKLKGDWQGPDRQAIVDYIDGKNDPKYLRKLKLKVTDRDSLYIATFKGRRLTIHFSGRKNSFSVGDTIQVTPATNEEGELTLGIARENDETILQRYKYDREKNQFHVLDEQTEESSPISPDQAREDLWKYLEVEDE